MPTTTEIKYWDKIASQTTIDPQFKSTCLGCKFLIREDAPECFLHWPVKIDGDGDPYPVEKCGRKELYE